MSCVLFQKSSRKKETTERGKKYTDKEYFLVF